MSAESITTALFLISAVIGAGVLINAIFPVIYKTTSSVETVSAQSETRLKTDIAIVATLAKSSDESVKVWLKNIGSERIHTSEINDRSTVIFGPLGNYDSLTWEAGAVSGGKWNYTLGGTGSSSYWDPGETLSINGIANTGFDLDGQVYFQFILPSGIKRSVQFTAY